METNEYNRGLNNSSMKDDFFEEEGDSINVMEWLMRFVSHWYLFVFAIIVALGFAYLKNRKWMPNFYTESKVIIETNTSRDFNFMQGFGSGPSNNELLIMSSYDLINRAVAELPFDIDYYVRGRFKTNTLYGREPVRINSRFLSSGAYQCEFRFKPINDKQFEIYIENDLGRETYPDFKVEGEYGVPIENYLFGLTVEKLYLPTDNTPFLFKFRTQLSLEQEFAARMSLSYVGEQTSVISLSLVGNNCNRDRDFLDKLVEKFLQLNLEEKNEEATRTINFINDQLVFISNSLDSSETQLRQFRRKYNMVDVNAHTTSVLSKLTSLDQQRSQLNLKDAYFDELSTYLNESLVKEKLVAPSSIGVSDPILLDLVTKFNEVQQKRAELGEKNPNYERYSRNLEEIRFTLIEVLANVRKIHGLERAAFESEYKQTMTELQELPERELGMVNIERQYKINDNYYTFLLQKQAEAQIRMASNVPDNKILQQARTSGAPVNSGDKRKTYMIFLVVGVALPFIFVILKELLNITIRTEGDIAKLTKEPLIGTILHTNNTTDKIITTKQTRSLFTERFRMLRSRLDFIVHRKDKITMLVSSAESKDGKTHFAINIAGTYSLLHKKVLLVDLDLRNPSLSRKFGYEKNQGLTNVMIGDISLEDAIIKANAEFSFDFLPAGVIPPNPSELISSVLMSDIFETLKDRYDYLLIDTSPLGLVADAYALTNQVDVNLIVARVGKTTKDRFKTLMQQFKQDKVLNTYVILNDMPQPKKSRTSKLYGKYASNNAYYYVDSDKYYTTDDE